MSQLDLASEFPAATRQAWDQLVAKVLKGADFEKKLVGKTYDGIRIEPLYPKAEKAEPVLRAGHGAWRVGQRVDHPDPAAANALALEDLQGAADTLVLVADGAATARGFGLPLRYVESLEGAFSGVMLDLVALRVETAPFDGSRVADLVTELVRRRGQAPGTLAVDFGLDPAGDLARAGRSPLPWSELGRRFAETASRLRTAGFGGTPVRVDTRPYHEAGAAEAQELAAALATGVAYLRALEAGGLTLEEARDSLSFLLVADADQFLTVAKFRALRRLWAKVETECGLAPKPIRLHGETAWRMLTRRDPWVNLLRGTIAAFSAGIGGADSVTVLPFTLALGLPDAFARRLARNTQLILLEESNVFRVADPVAGAGGFEALTDALAEAAWTGFREIEREGGMFEALGSGALAHRIAETRLRREAAAATRRDPITGTSEFPDMQEAPVAVLMPARAMVEAKEGALPSMRIAEPYEALRDRSDAVLAATGARPMVFLANLGPIAEFSARATFAKNAFEGGGIEAVTNDGFGSLEAMADAFAASGASVACLCSSDAIYAVQAASAAAALTAAGAAAIYLAGRPGEIEAELKAAGVTGFVYAGANLLRLLEEALPLAAPAGA